jgi:small-conductance mechanosensitive channel
MESFVQLKSALRLEIKEAFDREGIEIPFPHRSLYTGSVTEPFPVRVVAEPSPTPGQEEGASEAE